MLRPRTQRLQLWPVQRRHGEPRDRQHADHVHLMEVGRRNGADGSVSAIRSTEASSAAGKSMPTTMPSMIPGAKRQLGFDARRLAINAAAPLPFARQSSFFSEQHALGVVSEVLVGDGVRAEVIEAIVDGRIPLPGSLGRSLRHM